PARSSPAATRCSWSSTSPADPGRPPGRYGVAAMGRALLLTGVLLALAGCGTSSSTAVTATSLLLQPGQLPDYTRTHQDPVTVEELAGDAGDPGAVDRISGQGLTDASRATYQPR